MALKSLSSRAILGEFANVLESPVDHGLVGPLTHYVPDSNQFVEEHHFIGAVPGFIEWTGTRRVKQLSDYFTSIKNVPYEATLTVTKDEVTYDKTGQVQNRINAFGNTSNEHWEELISALIANGASQVCYDGQYYFDTDHVEGKSGTMSNLITLDISDMPFDSQYKGTPTAPSAMQIAYGVLAMIQQMYTFKNDQGKPINQSAREFKLVVPVTYMMPAAQAISQAFLGNNVQNPLLAQSFKVELAVDPRNPWTDSMALFRTDGVGGAKPIIRQQMGAPEFTKLDETSDLYHKERRMEFGAYTRRGAGYGLWQHGVKATFQA